MSDVPKDYSQWGEAGLLNEVLNFLSIPSGVYVELGAWDGEHLSNCRHLLDQGWSAVLIESDGQRVREMRQNLGGRDSVSILECFVSRDGPTNLESLLLSVGRHKIDLLSVDIDGDDVGILEGLGSFRPRVIIVEYNPTIPANISFRDLHGWGIGCSLLAIREWADEAGFVEVSRTQTNSILVAKEEYRGPLVDWATSSVACFRQNFFPLSVDYQGRLVGWNSEQQPVRRQCFPLPWGLGVVSQPFPRALAKRGKSFTALQLLYSFVATIVVAPWAMRDLFWSLRVYVSVYAPEASLPKDEFGSSS